MSVQDVMPFTTGPLSADLNFGKVIYGLRLEHLSDAGVRDALRNTWIQHGLVLFREGDVGEEMQVSLSKVFGPLETHPVKETLSASNPELITIASSPTNATIVEVDGVTGANFLGWHSDLCYVERINHGGLLRSLKPTGEGGLTGFIDQIGAYDALPERLKARIEDLSVVYQALPFDRFRYGYRGELKLIKISDFYQRIWDRLEDDFPPVVHPMLFVQEETGRKVLNISPFFAMYIEGMHNAEGDALLKELCDHLCNQPAYYHKWSTDEMILWDNWRMLHSVTPAPPQEERIMQRTTIKGDYGFGRKLESRLAA